MPYILVLYESPFLRKNIPEKILTSTAISFSENYRNIRVEKFLPYLSKLSFRICAIITNAPRIMNFVWQRAESLTRRLRTVRKRERIIYVRRTDYAILRTSPSASYFVIPKREFK